MGLIASTLDELRSGPPPPGFRAWADFREGYQCWERVVRKALLDEKAAVSSDAFAQAMQWGALGEFAQLVIMLNCAPALTGAERAEAPLAALRCDVETPELVNALLDIAESYVAPVEDLPADGDDDTAKVNANLQDLRDDISALIADLRSDRRQPLQAHRLQQHALGWIYFLFIHAQEHGPSPHVAAVQVAGRRVVRAAVLAMEVATAESDPDLLAKLKDWVARVYTGEDSLEAITECEQLVADASVVVRSGLRRSTELVGQ